MSLSRRSFLSSLASLGTVVLTVGATKIALKSEAEVVTTNNAILVPAMLNPGDSWLPKDWIEKYKGNLERINRENCFNSFIQDIHITADMSKEEIFELGRKAPYKLFVDFPVEVREDIEVL